ncbi:NADP-dependent oxidoreductase [Microbacterium aquilitoris]|uniref:NADP-dependent oxidoreductase n=1 Tax=Microbacterium aquilitoris TaxID=3067307 RepID=UPI00288C9C5B|nr:NADP-dependent oxidoreductase [Microbacterium sp. KSW2-22]MDT3344982.1 NADP-dependent oxidoreductase [Microbacterium sp. KSW2-22]
MKTMRFFETGDPSVLTLDDIETPTPGAGQVLLRVAGAGVNPADNGIRFGRLPIPITLPHTPGYDVSGIVISVGDGVTYVAVGDEVVGFLPMTDDGAAAEYVIAPAEALVSAPTSIALADAAGLPSVALTAWQALFEYADLHAGQRIVITGAGGVVGLHAVRLAKRAGAHVIATATGRSRAAVADAGADQVIDHTTTSAASVVDEPVDVVLNLAPISAEEFVALAARVRDGGVVVSTTAWMATPSDEARGVRGVTVFVRSDRDQLAELVRLVDSGELRVDIAERIPLAALPEVHARLEAGQVHGKIVVTPTA